MLVCCSVISLIVLLAVFGFTIIAIIQAILAKTERTAWAKTLVDFPMDKLKFELTHLTLKKGGLTSGYLEMSKGQQQQVVSKLGDIEARIKILECLISERQNLESGKK
jgi:hypothetical protein